MLRFIRFLFTGDWHLHEWEILGKGVLTDSCGYTRGYYYHQRCKFCGKLHYKEMK